MLVYEEASLIFYGKNTWRFPGAEAWMDLHRFLHAIGPTHREQIRHIQVLAPFAELWHPVDYYWPFPTLQVRDHRETKLTNHPPLPAEQIGVGSAVLKLL